MPEEVSEQEDERQFLGCEDVAGGGIGIVRLARHEGHDLVNVGIVIWLDAVRHVRLRPSVRVFVGHAASLWRRLSGLAYTLDSEADFKEVADGLHDRPAVLARAFTDSPLE